MEYLRILPMMTPEAGSMLSKHKYHGNDQGLLYRYFYSPVGDKVVEKLPRWLAPNTITFIGFVHVLVSLVLLYSIQGPSLVGPVPNWWCFVQCYSFFMYRFLDEIDGKQARRTGNGSGLGLLFDHGCDCFAMVLQTMMLLQTLQVGNNSLSLIVLFCTMGAFHLPTLEEYYTGTLYLPPINGVGEGSVFAMILYLITGFTGNGIWATKLFSGTWTGIDGLEEIYLGQFIIMILALSAFFTILFSIVCIIRVKYNPQPTQTEDVVFSTFGLQIFSLVYLSALMFILSNLGPDTKETIIGTRQYPMTNEQIKESTSDTQINMWEMFTLMYWYGFILVHQTMLIQISHISKQKYPYFSRIYIMNALGGTILAILYWTGVVTSTTDISWTLFWLLIATIVFQWIFILVIINEIADYLSIRIFHVKPATINPNSEPLIEQQKSIQVDEENQDASRDDEFKQEN